MKRKLVLAFALIMMSVGVAMSQGTQKTKNKEPQSTQKTCFVDKDNNKVCDKYEDGTCKTGNGKGLQDGSNKNNKNKKECKKQKTCSPKRKCNKTK